MLHSNHLQFFIFLSDVATYKNVKDVIDKKIHIVINDNIALFNLNTMKMAIC